MATVQDVIDRAESILNDADNVRWSVPELVLWVSDAVDQLLRYIPEAGATTRVIPLTADQPRQRYQDARRILDIFQNCDGAGNPTGNAIILTKRGYLDSCRRNWQNDRAREVDHWVYDPEHDRKEFWVYPAPRETAYVLATVVPEVNLTAATQTLPVGQQWLTALLNYTLSRAYAKNADYGGNMRTASGYYNAFASDVGIQSRLTEMSDPNTELEQASG